MEDLDEADLSVVLPDEEDSSERPLSEDPEKVEVRRLGFLASFSRDVVDVDLLRRVVRRRVVGQRRVVVVILALTAESKKIDGINNFSLSELWTLDIKILAAAARWLCRESVLQKVPGR